MKGTENNFNPVQCMDVSCPSKASPHLHCPFCVKTEIYQDPVILKAHYRVKHVDKGADFAGLKILRCCDRCYVVGSIKGEKVFKGPHWHCYKCRNGFNRRDEALKHYKTHFRNPQTTFQIQISQDVNPAPRLVAEGEPVTAAQTLTHEDFLAVQPTLAQVAEVIDLRPNAQVLGVETSVAHGDRPGPEQVLVSVAANETVEAPDTIMIIQEKVEDASLSGGVEDGALQIAVSETEHVANQTSMNMSEGHVQVLSQASAAVLEEKSKQLAEERIANQRLRGEVQQLRAKVESQAREIAVYREREKELLDQLNVPLESKVQDLLTKLQAEHTEMLYHHLMAAQRAYTESLRPKLEDTLQQDCIVAVPTGDQGQEEQMQIIEVTRVSADESSQEHTYQAESHTLLVDSCKNEQVLDVSTEGSTDDSRTHETVSLLIRKRKRENSLSEDINGT